MPSTLDLDQYKQIDFIPPFILSLIPNLALQLNLHHILATLDFTQFGHQAQPHQFGGLGDVWIATDGRDSSDDIVFGVVSNELYMNTIV